MILVALVVPGFSRSGEDETMKRNREAFTLIELLVAISIIALLMASRLGCMRLPGQGKIV